MSTAEQLSRLAKIAAFELDDVQAEFDRILQDHEALLDQASGFGMTASADKVAAYPKGLMPLADAQKVLAGFAASTKSLYDLRDKLYVRDVPAFVKAEYAAMTKKLDVEIAKFEADQKKATKALADYEDLLVGKYFQEAFEAVRHAVLDFDIAPDVDVDFRTDLKLDATPAYAVGWVDLIKGGTKAYQVVFGYRALDDYYYGHIVSGKRGKTYKDIVKKTGHAFLPKFVRELSEQLKALADSEGTNVFESRKKIDLKIVDPEVERQKAADEYRRLLLTVNGQPDEYSSSNQVYWRQDGMGEVGVICRWFPEEYSEVALLKQNKRVNEFFASLKRGWDIKVGDVLYRTKFDKTKNVTWESGSQKSPGGAWNSEDSLFHRLSELRTYFPEFAKDATLVQLQARAQAIGVNIAGTTQLGAIRNRILAKTKHHVDRKYSGVKLVCSMYVQKLTAPKVSSERVAGGSDFTVYARGADARQAFRDAVEEDRHENGNRGYSGTISQKSSFKYRKDNPMTKAEAHRFMDDDLEKNDKWGPAFAIPVCEERELGKDVVTVTVEAKNDADAQRVGGLRIKATGRIAPKASVVVTDIKVKKTGGTPRIGTYEVTGLRKQVVKGEIDGWYFYGIASS